jgi:hypothetical protein
MTMRLRPTLLKRVALVYAVKTLILGVAWLAVPDLPQRALKVAQSAWTRLAGDPEVAELSRR